jgi:hypothetical protein
MICYATPCILPQSISSWTGRKASLQCITADRLRHDMMPCQFTSRHSKRQLCANNVSRTTASIVLCHVADWCNGLTEAWPWPPLSSFTEGVTTITVREHPDQKPVTYLQTRSAVIWFKGLANDQTSTTLNWDLVFWSDSYMSYTSLSGSEMTTQQLVSRKLVPYLTLFSTNSGLQIASLLERQNVFIYNMIISFGISFSQLLHLLATV